VIVEIAFRLKKKDHLIKKSDLALGRAGQQMALTFLK